MSTEATTDMTNDINTTSTSNSIEALVKGESIFDDDVIPRTSEQQFRNGDTASVEERYEDAMQHYTTALQQIQQQQQQQQNDKIRLNTTQQQQKQIRQHFQFRCHLHRSMAYYNSYPSQPQLAYIDSTMAVQLLAETTEKESNNNNNNKDGMMMSDHSSSSSSSLMFTNHEIQLCHRHHGIVAFATRNFTIALRTFTFMVQHQLWNTTTNTTLQKYNESYYQNHVQQCQQQIQLVPISDVTTTTTSTMTNIAEDEDDDERYNVQKPAATTTDATRVASHTTMETSGASAASAPASLVVTKLNPATLLSLTPKYQYYQNDTHMIIQVIEPNVIPSNMTVQYIDAQQIFVSIHKLGHVLTLIQGELYDTIIPHQCTVSYRTDKVIIKMKKERPNYEWQTLLSESKKKSQKAASTSTTTTTLPTNNIPTATTTNTAISTTDSSTGSVTPNPIPDISETESSKSLDSSGTATISIETSQHSKSKIPKPYASYRDWDAIGKDVEEEIANETPVGDAAMNQLFQQIYANADDDTKRAMIKSYQTSGGTVLSTNWNEVAQKDYEHKDRVDPPEGQEWKTWEGTTTTTSNKTSKK